MDDRRSPYSRIERRLLFGGFHEISVGNPVQVLLDLLAEKVARILVLILIGIIGRNTSHDLCMIFLWEGGSTLRLLGTCSFVRPTVRC